MAKVLVVEDEVNIATIIKVNLQNEGFEVEMAHDGEQGYEKYKSFSPDIVLLDIMMPKLNGFEVCEKIREESNVPIIMLTARAEESDKVKGLELGADDYVVKPFGVKELIARVHANIRRSNIMQNRVSQANTNVSDDSSCVGDFNIIKDTMTIEKKGEALQLTRREYDLMCYFLENTEKVITREELLEDVWQYEYLGDLRTVDVTIRRLRAKIEDDTDNPKYLLTKRGAGYYFNV